MADDKNGGNATATKGGGRLKLVLLVVGLVVALAGGGGAAAFYFGLFGDGASAASAEEKDDDAGADADKTATGKPEKSTASFVDMPDILVNLDTSSSRVRFLKLRVALEVASDEVGERVRALTPRIMDSFQMYLRALTVEEVQGALGMQRLKEELMVRINHAIEPQRIEDVLFKEMLVQ